MNWKRAIIMAVALAILGPSGCADWTPAKRISWTSSFPYWPAIAAGASGKIHMVWVESSLIESDLFYMMSAAGGTTWTVGQRLTWTSGESWDPAMAVDSSGNIHVVWADEAPGNCEIYYKKSNSSTREPLKHSHASV